MAKATSKLAASHAKSTELEVFIVLRAANNDQKAGC